MPKVGKTVKPRKTTFHLPISCVLADQYIWYTKGWGDKACSSEPQGLYRFRHLLLDSLTLQNEVFSCTAIVNSLWGQEEKAKAARLTEAGVCGFQAVVVRRE